MTITDDRANDRRNAKARQQDSTSEYAAMRTPPHDMTAEQAVLGSMMLSKDAIADVIEKIHREDFYRPIHQNIYATVIDLYGRGEPADAVTVAADLDRRGQLMRVGGGPYLTNLLQSVPTAAGARYYAEIVAQRATMRRLAEAGTRIASWGYTGAEGEDVDKVVDQAQQELYNVTESRRSSSDFMSFGDLVQPTLDEIDALSTGSSNLGVMTGFQDLDELTNGLQPGQLIVIGARPGAGKALALDTPLPTPTGWTTMGTVAVGDDLIGADGRPTRIVAATEVLLGRPCYEVEFSDGTVIVADGEHQWLTETRASRKSAQAAAVGYNRYKNQRTFAAVRTTQEIAETLRCPGADRRLNHSVRNAKPLQGSHHQLPIPPYTFGAWLGDGTSACAKITTADPQIVLLIEAEGIETRPSRTSRYRYQLRLPDQPEASARECVVCGAAFIPQTSQVRTCGRSCGGRAKTMSDPVAGPTCRRCGARCTGRTVGRHLCRRCLDAHGSLQGRLRSIGVLGDKRIPAEYLRASESQRRALLAGLLDTDGTVSHAGSICFSVTNKNLAEDVYELIVSLGYRCGISTKRVAGRSESTSTAYTLQFATEECVFGLTRKAEAQKARRAATNIARSSSRFITAVRRVESVPVRCVQVDNSDHLFLAGRSMVPTHNSTLAMDILRSCSLRQGKPSVMFSLEMSRNEIMMRIISAQASIKLNEIRSGRCSDDDWTRMARMIADHADAPLFIDDSPNLTLMEIRAKARRLKQKHGLALIVVDYLQLMTGAGRNTQSREQEVAEYSRSLKLLAKEVDVPVIALSQLNRKAEERHDKRPQLSDLRESGSVEQDSDLVILIHRPDSYDRDDPRGGEADLLIAKNRHGATRTCTVAHQLHLSRFTDMARGL